MVKGDIFSIVNDNYLVLGIVEKMTPNLSYIVSNKDYHCILILVIAPKENERVFIDK